MEIIVVICLVLFSSLLPTSGQESTIFGFVAFSTLLTVLSAAVVWRRTHHRLHVCLVTFAGILSVSASVGHWLWTSHQTHLDFERQMQSLADSCASIVRSTTATGADPRPLIEGLSLHVPGVRRIEWAPPTEFEADEGEARVKLYAPPGASHIGMPTEPVRVFKARSDLPAGSLIEVFADEQRLIELESEGIAHLWGIHTASLFLVLASVILMIGALDRDRVRELDALSALLENEKERVTNVMNSVQGVVWERDADSGCFILLSRSADGFLGFPRDAWMASADFWRSRIHPGDRARVTDAWGRSARETRRYRLDYRVLGSDGRTAHIEENGKSAVSADGRRVFRGVFTDVSARIESEKAAEEYRRIQVETSRQAGMAELATGVLHNVGNVLNTLNVSARLLAEQLEESKIADLQKAAGMLQENSSRAADFLSRDPKGRALPGYIARVSGYLIEENQRMQGQIKEVLDRVDHIRDVIALQQKHGKIQAVPGNADLSALIHDALRLENDALNNAGVAVETRLHDLQPLDLTRSHILQILVNLLSNARHAVAANPAGRRRISIMLSPPEDGCVAITVSDNGCGIPANRLTRIFSHGFTTREDGHGFGLHHAGLLAQDMGGRLYAESEGPERGAQFTLELPYKLASHPSKAAPSRPPQSRSGPPREIAVEICS